MRQRALLFHPISCILSTVCSQINTHFKVSPIDCFRCVLLTVPTNFDSTINNNTITFYMIDLYFSVYQILKFTFLLWLIVHVFLVLVTLNHRSLRSHSSLRFMQHTFTASWKFKMVFDGVSIGAQAQHLSVDHLLPTFSFIAGWKRVGISTRLSHITAQWHSDTLLVLVRIQNESFRSILRYAARWINHLIVWTAQVFNIKIIQTNWNVTRHCIIHQCVWIAMRMFAQQSSNILNRIIVSRCAKWLISFRTFGYICYECSTQRWIYKTTKTTSTKLIEIGMHWKSSKPFPGISFIKLSSLDCYSHSILFVDHEQFR